MVSQEIRQPFGDESGFLYGYFVVGASMLIMSTMWGMYYAFGVFFKPVLNELG